jgi:hypothetical protein
VAIHNIDVDDGAAACGGIVHLIRQMGEVRGQNRGCEFNQPGFSQSSRSQEILTRSKHAMAFAAMHYIGMAAMRQHSMCSYSAALVKASGELIQEIEAHSPALERK